MRTRLILPFKEFITSKAKYSLSINILGGYPTGAYLRAGSGYLQASDNVNEYSDYIRLINGVNDSIELDS
jgi:hypothetical protein